MFVCVKEFSWYACSRCRLSAGARHVLQQQVMFFCKRRSGDFWLLLGAKEPGGPDRQTDRQTGRQEGRQEGRKEHLEGWGREDMVPEVADLTSLLHSQGNMLHLLHHLQQQCLQFSHPTASHQTPASTLRPAFDCSITIVYSTTPVPHVPSFPCHLSSSRCLLCQ